MNRDWAVLERVFDHYNGKLPADYPGRCVAPSDVLEARTTRKSGGITIGI